MLVQRFTRGVLKLNRPQTTIFVRTITEHSSIVQDAVVDANIEKFENESPRLYTPGTDELMALEKSLKKFNTDLMNVPIMIDGEKVFKGTKKMQFAPDEKEHAVSQYYFANQRALAMAIQCAEGIVKEWESTSFSERFQIWERAANLMSKEFRTDLVAATMIGQGKTLKQAELDVCALIDFMRLNPVYVAEAVKYQPISPYPNYKLNHMRLCGLDGFVAAITPFNSLASASNQALTPILMGNPVIWKPSEHAILSNYLIYKIMREAGLPDGVLCFVPSEPAKFASTVSCAAQMAGMSFAGSRQRFCEIWELVGRKIHIYLNFPRIVGECYSNNFHFVHPSADPNLVVDATVRAAFEYGGQKSSSCSRLFVPTSLWESKIKEDLINKTHDLLVGHVTDYNVYMSALINNPTFERVTDLIEYSRRSKSNEVIAGGSHTNLRGFFVHPTIILATDLDDKPMQHEILGPLLIVYVYKDDEIDKTIDIVNNNKYGLCGSVFGADEEWLRKNLQKFKFAAGNLFINDKCSDIIVGQQPFSGKKLCGTNDKVGGPHYVLRWASWQTITENIAATKEIKMNTKN